VRHGRRLFGLNEAAILLDDLGDVVRLNAPAEALLAQTEAGARVIEIILAKIGWGAAA
jgi:hypothetical protein